MELASLIVAIIALFVSAISFLKSNAASKLANDLTKGQVEIQIRNMISTAKSRFSDMSVKLGADINNLTLQRTTAASLEDVLNAYDEACAKYIDGKVDKERFKRLYITEIRNLVEDESTKKKFVMPQSRFQATVKVYNEWFVLDK